MGLLDSIKSGYNTFNQDLGQGMTSPLFTLGMGLMGAAQPFANPAQQIQGARTAALQQQNQQLQTLQGQMGLRMMMQQYPALMQALQSGGLLGGAPAAGAPTSGAPVQPSLLSALPQAPSSPGVTTAPYSPPSASVAPPAPQGAPQASAAPGAPVAPQGANPWALFQSGVRLSAFPMTKDLGAAEIQLAQAQLANDPARATQLAAAKSALAQDQYAIQQAQASGNPLAVKAAQMKYLTDAKLVNVAAYNGAVTTFGGVTPAQLGASTLNPVQGVETVNGVERPIPGAPVTRQALEAGQALGQAAGKTIPVANPSTGNVTNVPLDKYLAFLNQFPGGAAAQAGQAGVPISALGPGQHAQLASTGEESGKYLQTLQEQADAATTANYNMAQLKADAQHASLGPGAAAREWVENGLGSLGQQLGLPPPKELGSYQELDKYANQIAFAASRQMGSREAAQIVHLQMQSNPNKQLVPSAFNGLVDAMSAMNNYVIAKNTAIQQVATDKASALKAAATWTAKIDPRVWDLSLSPQLAAKFSGTIGADRIATTLPVMDTRDAVSVFRNIPASLRAAVLKNLPVAVKQELVAGLQ